MRYTFIAEHLESKKDSIQVLVLGSSQMKDAMNPDWLEKPSINLASTSQHLNTDFKLYQELKDRLPSMNTVVLELSYSHLELPMNQKEFWKYNIFKEYYDVNCFERNTWIKDRLIFFSNPTFYSDALYESYISHEDNTKYNRFGFDTNNFDGVFESVSFNSEEIAAKKFKITTKENLDLFKTNSSTLFSMLSRFDSDNIKVIIVTIPTYKAYLESRNQNILKRRDSILRVVKNNFKNVTILELESDTINFVVADYINHNHLNPTGARKFTSELNKLLEASPNSH